MLASDGVTGQDPSGAGADVLAAFADPAFAVRFLKSVQACGSEPGEERGDELRVTMRSPLLGGVGGMVGGPPLTDGRTHASPAEVTAAD